MASWPKISHEAVNSIGVLLSVAISLAALALSYFDRVPPTESIVLRLAEAQTFYATKILDYGDGQLNYRATYDVTVTNDGSLPTSIVEFYFAFADGEERTLVDFGYDPTGLQTFRPINLQPGESELFSIYLPMPISNECRFPELPLDVEVSVSEVAVIFSRHARTFPTCRDLEQNRYPADGLFGGHSSLEARVTTAHQRQFGIVSAGYTEIYLPEPILE